MVCAVHTLWRPLGGLEGKIHVYATFNPLPMNPVEWVDGQPSCRQTLTLGLKSGDDWKEALTFGVVDDDRASPAKKSNYVIGVSNGKIEYYGMFMRPRTPYDVKIELDLDRQRATAFANGRGDDQWFPLAVDVPLANPITSVNALRTDQAAASTEIKDVVIQPGPWADGERIRSHPQAKHRVIRNGQGFRFQSMRSLWMEPHRHVTVARTPNEAANWWLGFPDVVQTGPTTLVCVHNDGAGHGGGGRIWARLSDDLGQTWAKAVVVHPGPTNCPRIEKLKDGSLVIWRRVEVRYADTKGEYYKASWNASDDVFPDQYQLDHIMLLDASIAGVDQGYSGWRELPDGRVFVVNYTDDTARWNCDASYPPLGVSWIRGTFIHPEELKQLGRPDAHLR